MARPNWAREGCWGVADELTADMHNNQQLVQTTYVEALKKDLAAKMMSTNDGIFS